MNTRTEISIPGTEADLLTEAQGLTMTAIMQERQIYLEIIATLQRTVQDLRQRNDTMKKKLEEAGLIDLFTDGHPSASSTEGEVSSRETTPINVWVGQVSRTFNAAELFRRVGGKDEQDIKTEIVSQTPLSYSSTDENDDLDDIGQKVATPKKAALR